MHTTWNVTRGTTDTIRYEQIAQVLIDRRVMWSSRRVETNGGGGFTVGGLKKDPADAAKELIDQRVARVRNERNEPTRSAPSSSLASELTKLA
jgi:hypothetical protein